MSEKQGQYLTPPEHAPQVIRARGDVTTRVGVLWFVGAICTLLIIGGFTVFIVQPEHAKDVWVIIGPIISAAVSGTVSFLAGERSGAARGE